MADVPLPDPDAVEAVHAALGAVRHHAADGEEEALSLLAGVGEPVGQRALDDWVDQLTDTVRALAEAAEQHRAALLPFRDRRDVRTVDRVEDVR